MLDTLPSELLVNLVMDLGLNLTLIVLDYLLSFFAFNLVIDK